MSDKPIKRRIPVARILAAALGIFSGVVAVWAGPDYPDAAIVLCFPTALLLAIAICAED